MRPSGLCTQVGRIQICHSKNAAHGWVFFFCCLHAHSHSCNNSLMHWLHLDTGTTAICLPICMEKKPKLQTLKSCLWAKGPNEIPQQPKLVYHTGKGHQMMAGRRALHALPTGNVNDTICSFLSSASTLTATITVAQVSPTGSQQLQNLLDTFAESELFDHIIEKCMKERRKQGGKRETESLCPLFTVDSEHEEHAAVCAEEACSSRWQHPAAPGLCHSSCSAQMRNLIAQA